MSMSLTVTSIPRGKPKSGRTWKSTRLKRHSDMMRTSKSLKSSWAQKMKDRQEKKLLKLHVKTAKDGKRAAKELKMKRTADNKKRQIENERKSEIVQVIKNPAKIKKMKKKQLRMIAKR